MGELDWRLLDERPGPAGYLSISTRQYLLPDGTRSDWDILGGGRTVAVVALTEADSFVMVRQFRPGPGRVLLELPGGKVNEGEDLLTAAARELLEETGYRPAKLRLVGRTWLASYASIERYAVIAEGCRFTVDPTPDEEEFCQTALLSHDEFVTHVRSGDLTDTDIAYMCLDSLDHGALKGTSIGRQRPLTTEQLD